MAICYITNWSFFLCLAGDLDIRIANKYRLGRKIGGGSFGDIYLGELKCLFLFCWFYNPIKFSEVYKTVFIRKNFWNYLVLPKLNPLGLGAAAPNPVVPVEPNIVWIKFRTIWNTNRTKCQELGHCFWYVLIIFLQKRNETFLKCDSRFRNKNICL